MMMIYRKKNNKGRLGKILLISFIVLIFILGFFKINFIQNIFQVIGTPFVNIASAITSPFSNIGNYFVSKNDLIKQIEVQKDEINDLRIRVIKVDILESENAELLSLKNEFVSSESMLAKILVSPSRSPYDTFVINKGSNEGVSNNQRIFYKDMFIGNVIDVSSHTSVIKLLSSSGIETPVKISGKYEATAIGHGGGMITMTVPKDLPVDVSDVVTYSGENNHIVGVISHVVLNEEDSLKVLYSALPISVNGLNFVEVVK